jgi:dsDNA-binding SOS-regulon protein
MFEKRDTLANKILKGLERKTKEHLEEMRKIKIGCFTEKQREEILKILRNHSEDKLPEKKDE